MTAGVTTAEEPRLGEAVAEPGSTMRWRLWVALVVVSLVAAGAMEGWYGRADTGDLFGSDAVQYMDCARAFERGDFKAALNPLWSQGYPALLALTRPIFPGGMEGDWLSVKAVNLLVFCFSLGSFAYLLAGLRERRRDGVFWLSGASVFLAAQGCLGQVSRVGPDGLVAAFFFLACGVMLRLMRRPGIGWAVALGLALGLGFLVKAVFLLLGCGILTLLGTELQRRGRRLGIVAPAVLVFGAIVLGYGSMLSRAVGYRTLGEAGALNYAWHVNRLEKWVHWEGGVESAQEAWPKPWIARFARWESDPPGFGRPLHPSMVVGERPAVYVFHEPGVQATYVPYYDPAYWYRGYRHFFRWRLQAIALGKSLLDLAKALLGQPMLYGVLAAVWGMRRIRQGREAGLLRLLVGCAVLGILIYLPVHLEGRYLSGFLAVLGGVGLSRVQGAEGKTRRMVLALVLLGLAGQMLKEQRVVWTRAVHGWSYQKHVEWRIAEGLGQAKLPRGSEVGMISWTPNLHCDWAYLAGVRITSEIANGEDEKVFWGMDATGQSEVLRRFRSAGATAVLSWEGPPSGTDEGWRRVGETPMWMYRF